MAAKTAAFTVTATTAFQPNSRSGSSADHPNVAATITRGGAANGVSVPPTETFTNSVPVSMYSIAGRRVAQQSAAQQMGAHRHRRWLRNERSEQRSYGQRRDSERNAIQQR